MKRLVTLLASMVLTGSILAFTAPATFAVACSQLIYIADAANGAGGQTSFCAEDYPLSRFPATSVGDLSTIHYNPPFSGTSVDNTINSYNWDDSSLPGTRIRLFHGYNFAGTGDYIELVRPSGATPWTNLPSNFNNSISSYVGCGSTCSDDPN